MIHPLHTLGCAVRAAAHELRCWECRVTWTSWAQRLVGMKRGYTPKLSKQQRHLVERARRAEDALERIRALTQDEDGNALPPESELPVGVFYGVLYGTQSR